MLVGEAVEALRDLSVRRARVSVGGVVQADGDDVDEAAADGGGADELGLGVDGRVGGGVRERRGGLAAEVVLVRAKVRVVGGDRVAELLAVDEGGRRRRALREHVRAVNHRTGARRALLEVPRRETNAAANEAKGRAMQE